MERHQYGNFRRRKASSYSHLAGKTIGKSQGIFRMSRDLPLQIIMESGNGGRTLGVNRFLMTQEYMQLVLIVDFLFHNIDFPPSKANKVRTLKNGIGKPKRSVNPQWFDKNRAKILEVWELMKYPLKSEDSAIEVGAFKVLNPIHLSSDKVEQMTQAVEDSLRYCTNDLAPRFPTALYGNVTLAEKLGGHNTLAWYNPHKDDITMKYTEMGSSSVKGSFIHTFIHELGHRYFQKQVSAETKRLWRRYDQYAHLTDISDLLPEVVGDKSWNLYVQKKRTRYSITAEPQSGFIPYYVKAIKGRYIELYPVEDTPGYSSVQFDKKTIAGMFSVGKGVFPTYYATTDPEEHFCEALAHKALGKLNKEAERAFDAIFHRGEEYTPSREGYLEAPIPDLPDPSQPSTKQPAPETSPTTTLPDKRTLDQLGGALATQMGLTFQSGRKYGLVIYTNESVGSTHAYLFLDYTTGNLYVPKTKSAPNLSANIANVLDEDFRSAISFERMSSLRPKWRTQNTITPPTREEPQAPMDVADQTPEPDQGSTPENTALSVDDASTNAGNTLGMIVDIKRKFIRLVYTNPDTNTQHAYLWVERSSGNIYRPQSHNFPERSMMVANILEPNVMSKISKEAMDTINRKWRKQNKIPESKRI